MESLCCYFRRELNRRIQDAFDDCYFADVGCFLKLQIQSLHSVIQE